MHFVSITVWNSFNNHVLIKNTPKKYFLACIYFSYTLKNDLFYHFYTKTKINIVLGHIYNIVLDSFNKIITFASTQKLKDFKSRKRNDHSFKKIYS